MAKASTQILDLPFLLFWGGGSSTLISVPTTHNPGYFIYLSSVHPSVSSAHLSHLVKMATQPWCLSAGWVPTLVYSSLSFQNTLCCVVHFCFELLSKTRYKVAKKNILIFFLTSPELLRSPFRSNLHRSLRVGREMMSELC